MRPLFQKLELLYLHDDTEQLALLRSLQDHDQTVKVKQLRHSHNIAELETA